MLLQDPCESKGNVLVRLLVPPPHIQTAGREKPVGSGTCGLHSGRLPGLCAKMRIWGTRQIWPQLSHRCRSRRSRMRLISTGLARPHLAWPGQNLDSSVFIFLPCRNSPQHIDPEIRYQPQKSTIENFDGSDSRPSTNQIAHQSPFSVSSAFRDFNYLPPSGSGSK